MATMMLHSSVLHLTSVAKVTSLSIVAARSESSPPRFASMVPTELQLSSQTLTRSLCSCGRRHLIQACVTSLIPSPLSHATPLLSDSKVLRRNRSSLFLSFLIFLMSLTRNSRTFIQITTLILNSQQVESPKLIECAFYLNRCYKLLEN